MDISTELEILRNADPGAVLPGIDTQVGNPLPPNQLISATTLTQNGNGAPYWYDAKNHRIVVSQNGAVLNGINFGGLTVEIRANNVTIEDSTFGAPIGSAAIQVDAGFSGTVVTNNTFNSQLVTSNSGWIYSAARLR